MSSKTKEFAGQTPDAVQWLTNKPEKEKRFAEIVIRVQAGDDLWVEYLVAPENEAQAASVELLRAVATAKKKAEKQHQANTPASTPKTTALRSFFSPATSKGGSARASQVLSTSASNSPAAPRKVSDASVSAVAVFGAPLSDTMMRERLRDPSAVVPRIVRDGIFMILRRGLWVEGIFRLSGAKGDVDHLKQSYDSAEEFDLFTVVKDVNVVASLLKQYLRELPEPLLPVRDYDEYLLAVQLPSEEQTVARLKELIQNVPENNLQVLSAFVKMLNCVTRNSKYNKMSGSNCAIVLGPNILRKPMNIVDAKTSAIMAMDTADVNRVAEFLINHPHLTLPADEVSSDYGRFETKLVGHNKSVLSIVNMGSRLCSIDSSGCGNLWNPDFSHGGTFDIGWRPLGASVGNKHCWVYGTAGLDVRDAEGNKLMNKTQPFFCCTAVASRVWLGTDKAIVVLDAETFEEHGRLQLDCELVFCLLHVPASSEVWAGALDNSLKVFDAITMALKFTIPAAHKKRVMQMCVGSDGKTVYTASEDGSVALWNVATRGKMASVQAHESKCNGVCVVRGNYVFTCGWDTTIRVFTAADLKPVHVFSGYHDDALYSLLLVDTMVWAACGDRCVSIWSVDKLN